MSQWERVTASRQLQKPPTCPNGVDIRLAELCKNVQRVMVRMLSTGALHLPDQVLTQGELHLCKDVSAKLTQAVARRLWQLKRGPQSETLIEPGSSAVYDTVASPANTSRLTEYG
jgi:hypothetical protein